MRGKRSSWRRNTLEKTRPIEAQGSFLGGVGQIIMPGDKDYNRGTLNPKSR
ncbi:MAG: hypothetical protein RLZZ298_1193 [Pseudomonadota bacterium]|jgi:hypothetical protein